MKYEVSKEMSAAAIKAAAKENLLTLFTEFLIEKFGDDNVAMCRLIQGDGGKNFLALVCGEVEQDETTYDVCAKIEISIPEWEDVYSSKSGKLWRERFDFGQAKADYEKWTAQKAQKAADAAEKKAKKKAADEAMRAKRKAEREQAKGEGE